jgi:hypothetical protein
MNVKLLAVSALLVQINTLLVSHNCQLFCIYPMLSQTKYAMLQQATKFFTKIMAAAQRELKTSIQPLKRLTDYKNKSVHAVRFT